MYRYEEMNLRELMSNDTLDPESAEVLYAMAQCYRLGKGTEVDMELYKKSLEGAADAGSEMAKEELQTLENRPEEKAEENEPEVQKNLTKLPMDELMDLVHEDDIRACCEVYRRYGKEESRHLIHAAELIDQGNHSLNKEECQKVLETLAEYYLNAEKDNKKAMEAYGKAAELGSAAACWKLAELCADEQQKLFYAKKAADLGSNKDVYHYAEMLWEKGRVAEADACFAKLMKKTDLDESLKVLIKAQYHTDAEIEEVAHLAWNHTDEKVCRDFLTEYYGPSYAKALDEGKNLTSDQAYQLAMWNKGEGWASLTEYGRLEPTCWYEWLTFAAKKGSDKAFIEAKKQCQKWYQQGIERRIAGGNGAILYMLLTYNQGILDERSEIYAEILQYSTLKKAKGESLPAWNYITIQGNKYEVTYSRDGAERILPQAWKFAENPLCKGYLLDYYGSDPMLMKNKQLPTAEQAYQLAMWNKGAGWGGVQGDEWVDNPWYHWLTWSAERGNPQAIVEAEFEEERRKAYREEQDAKQKEQEAKQKKQRTKEIRGIIIFVLIVMIILIVIVTFVVKHFTELLDAFAPLLVFGLFCGVLKFLKSLSN